MLGIFLICFLCFVILVLPPSIVAVTVWTVLALLGCSRRQLLLAAPVLLLLSFGGEAWFIYWLRTPHTPDLTQEGAAKILLSRPEFTSQGHSPSFREVRRSEDSSERDYLYSGTFSFVKNTGERVPDANAQFQFSNGRWTFFNCRWGPSIQPTYITLGSTEPHAVELPPKNIVSPFTPGVCWNRLPDGTYRTEKPGSDACQVSSRRRDSARTRQ